MKRIVGFVFAVFIFLSLGGQAFAYVTDGFSKAWITGVYFNGLAYDNLNDLGEFTQWWHEAGAYDNVTGEIFDDGAGPVSVSTGYATGSTDNQVPGAGFGPFSSLYEYTSAMTAPGRLDTYAWADVFFTFSYTPASNGPVVLEVDYSMEQQGRADLFLDEFWAYSDLGIDATYADGMGWKDVSAGMSNFWYGPTDGLFEDSLEGSLALTVNGRAGHEILFSMWVYNDFEAFSAPIPGAVWMLGSGLLCLIGLRRKIKR